MILVANYWTHPAPRWLAAGLEYEASDVLYATALAFRQDGLISRLPLPRMLRLEIARRSLPHPLSTRNTLVLSPFLCIVAILAQRLGWHGIHTRFVAAVNSRCDRKVVGLLRRRTYPITGVVATASLSPRLLGETRTEKVRTLLYLPLPHYAFTQGALIRAGIAPGSAGIPDYTCAGNLDLEMNNADGYLGGSSMVAASTEPWAGRPLIIHPPGVADLPTALEELPSEGADMRETGGSSPLRLVFVGRIAPQKGTQYLFEALSGVSRGMFQLTIVSADSVKFRQLIKDMDLPLEVEVRDAMPRSELLAFLPRFDVFVLPSLYEGFALVLAEALAVGLPVVATSMTGASDIGLHERAGLVVPPADSPALAGALQRLCDSPTLLLSFRENARAVAEALTWENYARDVVPQVVSFFATGTS